MASRLFSLFGCAEGLRVEDLCETKGEAPPQQQGRDRMRPRLVPLAAAAAASCLHAAAAQRCSGNSLLNQATAGNRVQPVELVSGCPYSACPAPARTPLCARVVCALPQASVRLVLPR